MYFIYRPSLANVFDTNCPATAPAILPRVSLPVDLSTTLSTKLAAALPSIPETLNPAC